jgi:hypothetical protein
VSGACPPNAELERLLASQLSEAQEQALELHVAGCESCQRQLGELTRFAPGTSTLSAGQSADARRSPAGAGPHQPGGVLARLANSSRPILRVIGKPGKRGSRRCRQMKIRFRLFAEQVKGTHTDADRIHVGCWIALFWPPVEIFDSGFPRPSVVRDESTAV